MRDPPPKLLHQNSCPIPLTSKGDGGRPKGEPESFSDYNMIYDFMQKRSHKTEQKQINRAIGIA